MTWLRRRGSLIITRVLLRLERTMNSLCHKKGGRAGGEGRGGEGRGGEGRGGEGEREGEREGGRGGREGRDDCYTYYSDGSTIFI